MRATTVAVLALSIVLPALPIEAEPLEPVSLPIQSLRITEVTSFITRGSCQISGLDIPLTPANPSFSISTGCTEVTVLLTGNQVLISRVPGGEDFYVTFADIVVAAPASAHPYVPILVSQRPGTSTRMTPYFEIDGVEYQDAAGTRHPTCDCDYTFPAPSGSTIRFGRGSVSVRADTHDYLKFAALTVPPPTADTDGDGQDDPIDRCSGTSAGSTVDGSGCSQDQFCQAIPLHTWTDSFTCMAADWQGDGPLGNPQDCLPNGVSCEMR
jgi:hypothetical protein